MIIAGASPGETKVWAAVRENGDFFALAVRITGKLLKIDGYMLRGVWQALNFSFRPCNILRDNRRGVSMGNKNVGCGMCKRLFCTCGWNNWETVEDR